MTPSRRLWLHQGLPQLTVTVASRGQFVEGVTYRAVEQCRSSQLRPGCSKVREKRKPLVTVCGFPTRGHDASQITLALGTAASYPRACQALGAMLSRGALNPADITVLFKMFTSMDPPPVELVSCLRFSEARSPHQVSGGWGRAPGVRWGGSLGGTPSSPHSLKATHADLC